jgi:hypothetical protein
MYQVLEDGSFHQTMDCADCDVSWDRYKEDSCWSCGASFPRYERAKVPLFKHWIHDYDRPPSRVSVTEEFDVDFNQIVIRAEYQGLYRSQRIDRNDLLDMEGPESVVSWLRVEMARMLQQEYELTRQRALYDNGWGELTVPIAEPAVEPAVRGAQCHFVVTDEVTQIDITTPVRQAAIRIPRDVDLSGEREITVPELPRIQFMSTAPLERPPANWEIPINQRRRE